MARDSHIVTVGDRLFPLSRVLLRNNKPVNLTNYTVKWQMVNDGGSTVTAATTVGITSQPTTTFTASATTNLLTAEGHLVEENDELILSNAGGSLPGGLSAATRYFAKEVTPNAFKLAATPGGSAIDVTSAGTGTHAFYIVGHVTYQFASGEVATSGTYWGWLSAYDGGGLVQHWPDNGRGLRIDIVEVA